MSTTTQPSTVYADGHSPAAAANGADSDPEMLDERDITATKLARVE
jgi:hypothetical protein